VGVRFYTLISMVLTCLLRAHFACQAQNSAIPADVSSVPAIISSFQVSPQAYGLAIEIAVSAPFTPQGVQLTGPDRLVFDFPGYEWQGENQRIPVNRGPVQQLRLSLFQAHPPITRLVIDAKEPLKFKVQPAGGKIVIEIDFPGEAPFVSASSTQASTPEKKEAHTTRPVLESQGLPEMATPAAEARLSAYTLQAKAKTLKLEDLQSLEDRAKAGDPEAETTLALAYHDAVLLKKDDAESLRLLHKAADGGFMAAQESLGIFAETGVGRLQPVPAEALDWYQKAAQNGSLDAATNIALMYAGGIGVPKDPAQAAAWFRRAAEGGDATAQYNLALRYLRGSGVPQDYKESVHWLTAAADQNVAPAALDLANFWMHPPDGSAAEVSRAVHYYEKAGNLGNARAQAILGSIFATGVQGKPDYEQAVKWYRKAADRGEQNGEFGLGLLYALGNGVALDLEEARRLFIAAADQGQPDAQYDLAAMLDEGNGVPADPSLAAHYYELAAEQGVTKAQFRLGQLLAENSPSPSDRVSAYKWLMLAQSSIKESSTVLSELRKSMSAHEVGEAEHAVDKWRMAHRKGRQSSPAVAP
jgi:uncharacterized protein